MFVWSRLTETGASEQLLRLPALRPPATLIAGGPGWCSGLPPHVRRADSLGAAIEMLLDATAL